MFRWSYLVPRLIILGLITLAVWISADPLLKYAIVKSAESVTGSKVEIGKVSSSLLKGKVYLQELAVSDPRNPMQNLIQADAAYLQLNPQRLLHRELVIEHGHSTHVMFGASRTSSGELENREYRLQDPSIWLPTTIQSDAVNTSKNWLDSIQSTSTRNGTKNLELVRVSKEIQEKWPTIFDQKRIEIARMQNQIASLKRILEKPKQNPLRQLEANEQAVRDMARFQTQLAAARNQMAKLVESANADIQRVTQAKKQDTAKVSQYSTSSIEADAVSHLLLAKDQEVRLQEVINWIRWFRNSIPDPQADFYPSQIRGNDVAFQGQKLRPQFLIKNLELEGQGTLSDQHFDFAGVAKNLTTQPTRHDQPATFELRAQGEQHLIVNCTLDRRYETWTDKMQITCPELSIPDQDLGDGETMVVQSRPSRMQANVDIEINGEELSGTLEFRHSNCSLYLEKIDDFAGGIDMQLRMNQELAQIQQFSTYATLGGTLDKPTIEFTSDLGQQFAAGMNRIVKEQSNQQVADLKMQIEQRYQQEVQELNQMLQMNFREIAQTLNGESTIVAELIESLPEQDDWRR